MARVAQAMIPRFKIVISPNHLLGSYISLLVRMCISVGMRVGVLCRFAQVERLEIVN